FANTGTVTRPMVLNGDVLVSARAGPATIGSASLNNNVMRVDSSFDGMNAAIVLTGNISGAGSLIKANAGGLLTLSGVETYSGGTTITGGTLALGAADRLLDSGAMALGGGTFSTGGFNETLGLLSLTADSHIDLGGAASVLHFADSSAAAWTGALFVDNWSGDPAGGGIDQLYVGGSASGLTPAQLGSISFSGFPSGA